MSQANIQAVRGTSFVGIESTFGTTPSTVAMFPVQEGQDPAVKPTMSQQELEDATQSNSLFKTHAPILGLKSDGSGCTFKCFERPAAAQLDASATPATPWIGRILKAVLGGESSGAGSTVQTLSTASTVIVATGHGTRFTKNTPIAVEVDGVLEVVIVTAISTDTLSVWPELSDAPDTGGKVVNSYSYFLTQSNTQSLTVEHAADTNEQYRFRGCTGGVSFGIERGTLATAAFDLKAATWDFGALGLSTSAQTQTMGTPVAVVNAHVFLQDATATNRTATTLETHSITIDSGMEHIPGTGNDVEGTVGTFRTKGRGVVTMTAQLRADSVYHATYWATRTDMRMLMVIPQGSGDTKQFVVHYMPLVRIVGAPRHVSSGGRMLYEITLVADGGASATADTAAASPYVHGLL